MPVHNRGGNALTEAKRLLLGVGINPVTPDGAVDAIISAAAARRRMAVSALAVHGVMTGVSSAAHRHRLNQLDLVVPDGQPVRWALNILYRCSLAERVYGPRLMLDTCERAARDGIAIYLFGSTDRTLSALRTNLLAKFPRLTIAGMRPSRFRILAQDEKDALTEEIRASGAGIVFVGLGCPRQEVWAYEYREHLHMPIIAVGAAFDFHAGILPTAPAVLQRLGLEWAFRLYHEPRRLWRRYLLLNPAYITLVTLQALRIRSLDDAGSAIPPEIGYG